MNGDNNELISNDKIRLKMYNSNIKNNQINNNKEIVKYSQINNTYDLDSKNNDASYQDNLMVNNGSSIEPIKIDQQNYSKIFGNIKNGEYNIYNNNNAITEEKYNEKNCFTFKENKTSNSNKIENGRNNMNIKNNLKNEKRNSYNMTSNLIKMKNGLNGGINNFNIYSNLNSENNIINKEIFNQSNNINENEKKSNQTLAEKNGKINKYLINQSNQIFQAQSNNENKINPNIYNNNDKNLKTSGNNNDYQKKIKLSKEDSFSEQIHIRKKKSINSLFYGSRQSTEKQEE